MFRISISKFVIYFEKLTVLCNYAENTLHENKTQRLLLHSLFVLNLHCFNSVGCSTGRFVILHIMMYCRCKQCHYFLAQYTFNCHVRWVPCHHGMAHPQVADGGDAPQFWRVPVNILNKQSRTADKGWSSSLGVGRGANNSPP
jgi:hypothetical protein